MEETTYETHQEAAPPLVDSHAFTKKVALIVIAAFVSGFVIAMVLVKIRSSQPSQIKDVPFPTQTGVSPTQSLLLPTRVPVVIPTTLNYQCQTSADCTVYNYCTDREPPACHTFLCLKGYCREANDEVIRPMPGTE